MARAHAIVPEPLRDKFDGKLRNAEDSAKWVADVIGPSISPNYLHAAVDRGELRCNVIAKVRYFAALRTSTRCCSPVAAKRMRGT